MQQTMLVVTLVSLFSIWVLTWVHSYHHLLVGWTKEQWGFHAGFLVAAVGMFIGLIVFVLSKKNLGLAGSYANEPIEPGKKT